MTYHGEDTAQGIGGIRADRQNRRPKHHPVQLNAAAGRWALMYAASTFAQAPQPGGGDQYYPKVDSRNEISAAFRCAAVIRRSSSSSTGPCHPTRLCCSQNAPGLEERRGTSHFWDLFMAQNCFCSYFGAIISTFNFSCKSKHVGCSDCRQLRRRSRRPNPAEYPVLLGRRHGVTPRLLASCLNKVGRDPRLATHSKTPLLQRLLITPTPGPPPPKSFQSTQLWRRRVPEHRVGARQAAHAEPGQDGCRRHGVH